MSVPIQPMADYVVVETEEKAAAKTASGIYLPENAQEKSKVSTVVAIGKDVEGVKVGDRILYKNEYEASGVKIDGKDFTVIYKKNIIATVK